LTERALAAKAFDEPASATAAETSGPVRDAADFHRRFSDLVSGLEGVAAVIVFIDDLDRCLPETVVDTFEAIRLFLNAPRTAYVVAASRDIVESAVDSRYPELRKRDGSGIGHDYLEKMLQLQVRVPPLSASETEAYVNLLVTELHLDDAGFSSACEALRARRGTDPFGATYNSGLAGEVLGELLTPGLSADLAWASAVSPALSDGLRGNPRQIKRFLNDLRWRQKTAERRGVELRADVLAKLMVLEEQDGGDFQTLFDWQFGSEGPSRQIVLAQAVVRADAPPPPRAAEQSRPAKKKAAAEPDLSVADANDEDPRAVQAAAAEAAAAEQAEAWAALPRTRSWLRLPPDLSQIDLRPYFTYFRDRLVVGTSASALRPALQALLGRLTSEIPLVAREAVGACESLQPADQNDVVAALLDTAARRPDGPVLDAAAALAGRLPRTAATVCDALGRIPHASLPPLKIPGLLLRLPDGPEKAALASGWTASGVPAVAAAAAASSRPRPAGRT